VNCKVGTSVKGYELEEATIVSKAMPATHPTTEQKPSTRRWARSESTFRSPRRFRRADYRLRSRASCAGEARQVAVDLAHDATALIGGPIFSPGARWARCMVRRPRRLCQDHCTRQHRRLIKRAYRLPRCRLERLFVYMGRYGRLNQPDIPIACRHHVSGVATMLRLKGKFFLAHNRFISAQ